MHKYFKMSPFFGGWFFAVSVDSDAYCGTHEIVLFVQYILIHTYKVRIDEYIQQPTTIISIQSLYKRLTHSLSSSRSHIRLHWIVYAYIMFSVHLCTLNMYFSSYCMCTISKVSASERHIEKVKIKCSRTTPRKKERDRAKEKKERKK